LIANFVTVIVTNDKFDAVLQKWADREY